MNVIFFDKQKETYKRINNILQLESAMIKVNGRYTNLWLLINDNGLQETYKQKDFTIYRIEA